jgi:hypothetical protein
MISFKQNVKWGNGSVKCRLIDWCLAPTLAVFQLYRVAIGTVSILNQNIRSEIKNVYTT